MLKAIDRIMIATDDIEAAQRQCVALLGRSPSWAGEYAGQGVRHVLFRLENTQIELLAPVDVSQSNAALRAHLDEHGPSLFGIALETEDLGEAVESMEAQERKATVPTSLLVHDAASGAYRRLLQSEVSPTSSRGVQLMLTEPTTAAGLVPPALPLAEEPASVHRIDHLVVFTQDPEHAISLYRDGLGIRLALDRTFENRGIRLLFFKLGGTTIEISSSIRSGAEGKEGDASIDRLWGLAYQVSDADRAHARLSQADFVLTPVRPGHKEGTRVFTVKAEPLGVPTLIIEPVKSDT